MAKQAADDAMGPERRRERLAELILAESRRAGLGAGSRLPTERQLANALGASRTSVRHALAMLEAEGLISREVGRGTFLRQPPWPRGGRGGHGLAAAGPDGAPEPGGGRGPLAAAGAAWAPADAAGAAGAPGAAGFAPADVMAIRRLLEPPAMRLVVAWATASDFAEIGRCLAGGERAASYEEFEVWDLALHRAIMAASHSPLLVTLYAVIEAARHNRFWGDLKRRSASRERQRAYQADHAELVAALRARDADRAAEAMRAHLSRVAGHLFGEPDT
ncbi:MAG TPA: FCD domain-containing protein [Streptosporangiaceae bacterium]|nr:FCD domain-containing protein [Streptosporangiaceae bacterium]